MKQNLKTFICYSFDSPFLDEFKSQPDRYIPVKCGSYENDSIQLSDNVGDSISQYNKYLNEMTLIWAVGKKFEQFGNPDFVSFAHYRRYIAVKECDLIPNVIYCHKSINPQFTIQQLYGIYHDKSDLDLFMKFAYQKLDDHFYGIMQYLEQHITYTCNMFVMHKDVFKQYFSFIERCIKICIDDMFPILELDERDRYQCRALGFILERMTGYWIWMQKQQNMYLKVVDCPIVEENVESIYSRQVK